MTKAENSSDLINNLLLNLDNLQTIAENNSDKFQTTTESNSENVEDVSDSIKDQLESLRIETAKITSKYTCNSPTKSKTKKIPPPIITSPMHSRLQTIDDMLFELNNFNNQFYSGNRTPSSKSGKGRKFPNSFIDPRRFSDPYKYTILSTLNETEDGEEEEECNTPQTPKTSLPHYSRKKDYKNITCNGYNMSNVTPKSACYSRSRSFSQPEHYSPPKKNLATSTLRKSASISYNMNEMNNTSSNYRATSMDYFNNIKTSVSYENLKNQKKVKELVVKPPRTSSMIYNHHGLYNVKPVRKNSNNDNLDFDPESRFNKRQSGEMQVNKKNYLGLENKSSFQSDITLVNEE